MFIKMLTMLFGSSNERQLKVLETHVEPINELEPKFEAMSDSELKNQTQLFRERLAKGETLDDIMYEAFAVVREGAKRAMGMRHYDVQMIGGVVLHQGNIAEMKTGEGKTLVATLAVYLNALPGKGVHVVTVNDYLAKRDSEWMGTLYEFLGLTVGCIVGGMDDTERKAAYNCDITYGTNNELGFDYLRDNMKFSLDQMVQREFHFAIIDEVDSILIDEARTPLIISGPSESSQELYVGVNNIIPELTPDDYELDEKHRTMVLSEDGQENVEQLLRKHGLLTEGVLYDLQNIDLVLHVNQALKAHKLFKKDTDYIVQDNRVILIDEFTGRMKPDSRLSEGQHQAIEAKEGVPIMTENQTLASITYQNYFRLYPKLAGMTGTAMTEADEFAEIYKLGVVAIPTNEPIARADHDDKIYKSLKDKDEAVIEEIRNAQSRQQPVLVGTVSIEKSESLSANLTKQKIKHKVLNARHHEQEAQIIAQAGRPGAVTIATNMAGRGTDIQLGGNLEMRISEEIDESWSEDKKNKAIEKIKSEIERDKKVVLDAGGLYVMGTERHESRRIDNQLRGRSGRQGDPGASMFFLSVEDDLMRRFAQDRMESLLNNKRIGLEDGEALEHPWISKLIQHAQTKVENQHFEARKHILKYDDVMNDQRKVIYEQRREIMEADTLDDTVKDMRHETIEEIVRMTMPPGTYAEQWDIDALQTENQRLLGLDAPFKDWAAEEGIADTEMLERLIDASDKKMAEKAVNIGSDLWRQVEKSVVLGVLDQYWKEHLLTLDHLRQGIGLRGLGQRDPLNEYKTEAFALFETMLMQIREQITMRLSLLELDPEHISILSPEARRREQQYRETRQDPALMGTGQVNRTSNAPNQGPAAQPFRHKDIDPSNPETWGKTPRNAPCPCGSGKKFKHCHGKILQSA